MRRHALVLASSSPRRRALLDQLGVEFRVDPPSIEETMSAGEPAAVYVQRVAREKAAAVADRYRGANVLVLAADTCVVSSGQVLGKPRDRSDGMNMLAALSGRRHSVLTGVCLWGEVLLEQVLVETEVEFVRLTTADCKAYMDTSEPWDKAGSYAIQGLAGAFVRSINGSYSNVVGLPLAETVEILSRHGVGTALNPPDESLGQAGNSSAFRCSKKDQSTA